MYTVGRRSINGGPCEPPLQILLHSLIHVEHLYRTSLLQKTTHRRFYLFSAAVILVYSYSSRHARTNAIKLLMVRQNSYDARSIPSLSVLLELFSTSLNNRTKLNTIKCKNWISDLALRSALLSTPSSCADAYFNCWRRWGRTSKSSMFQCRASRRWKLFFQCK